MKCANCERQASYLSAPPAVEPVYYCEFDLPANLQLQADAGLLDIPEDPDERPPSSAMKARKAR